MHAFRFPKEVMTDLLPALNSPRRKSEHTIVQFKLQGRNAMDVPKQKCRLYKFGGVHLNVL